MPTIPRHIADWESVMRTIFSPANFSKSGKLRPNYMRPQISKCDEDDDSIASNKLSVTRLDYTDLDFCKNHAKKHSFAPSRNYWGFAKFIVKDIRTCSAEVVYKPVEDNPAHANIVYPFQIKVGETLDPEIELMITQLVAKAQIVEDSDLNSTAETSTNP